MLHLLILQCLIFVGKLSIVGKCLYENNHTECSGWEQPQPAAAAGGGVLGGQHGGGPREVAPRPRVLARPRHGLGAARRRRHRHHVQDGRRDRLDQADVEVMRHEPLHWLITCAHNTVHRVTNEDGRASNFLSWDDFKPGTYKMHFATSQYFKEKLTETFYPYAEVTSLFTFPCWFYWLHDATAGCIWDQGSWQPLPHSPAAQPLRILDIPRLLSAAGQSKV